MNANYTFRDFIAYFITGSVSIFIILMINYELILKKLFKFLKEEDANLSLLVLTFIFFIPLIYLIGQFVATIDFLVFHRLSKKILEKCPKCIIPNWLFTKYRISGIIKDNWKLNINFWQACSKLQVNKVYEKAEYRYILNDLFKNLIVLNSLLFIYAIYLYLFFDNYSVIIGLIFSFVLLRARAKMLGELFVKNVYGLYLELETENKKNELKIINDSEYSLLLINDYSILHSFWKRNGITVNNINGTKEETFKKYLQLHPDKFIVIQHTTSKDIVGAAVYFINGRKASIERLCVDKKHRRKRIANFIIDIIEKLVLNEGITKIYCLIMKSNFESTLLFRKNNFTELFDVQYFIKELKSVPKQT